jgi:GTP-binding protein
MTQNSTLPDPASRDAKALPLVAIVGRPNVGKSTLFNRITRSRQAIVGDEPGITRDRNYAVAEWRGRPFELVDTGGLLPGDEEVMARSIYEQAGVALGQAAQVVLVVDGRGEITAADRDLAQRLLRLGKPLALAVNKADTPAAAEAMSEWHELGIANTIPISAENGLGVDQLLDEVTSAFPPPAESAIAPAAEIRVAIIGRPNVGKSTLLNALAGEERAIVSPIPGTTRDAVDLLVERDGARFRLVDTAGIRRRGKTRLMAEKLSVVMAQRHIRMCDVAVLLIDAGEGVAALDSHIAGYAQQSGKGVVLALNKWDAVADRLRSAGKLQAAVREELKFLDHAPLVYISAELGTNLDKLIKTIVEVYQACGQRIPTAELNRFFETLDFDRASQPAGQRIKVSYLTQAGTHPPTFVMFTNRAGKLHFSFERYLENQLRRRFGFSGAPIVIKNKAKGR